ncbi:uncharacterized protein LOC101240882 isoform X1 [Hydra vulgaris]|uniref:uncharacterized protein LOC101240882 isoform X1 n=1 Tax=Hydra vulgaris TaxID=6087 RepID=UPI00064142A7|nr:uncharacterized protein LOC101240882 [Hydra vulgaris]
MAESCVKGFNIYFSWNFPDDLSQKNVEDDLFHIFDICDVMRSESQVVTASIQASKNGVILSRPIAFHETIACELQIESQDDQNEYVLSKLIVVSEAKHLELYVNDMYIKTSKGLMLTFQKESLPLFQSEFDLAALTKKADKVSLKFVSLPSDSLMKLQTVVVFLSKIPQQDSFNFDKASFSVDLKGIREMIQQMGLKVPEAAENLMNDIELKQNREKYNQQTILKQMYNQGSFSQMLTNQGSNSQMLGYQSPKSQMLANNGSISERSNNNGSISHIFDSKVSQMFSNQSSSSQILTNQESVSQILTNQGSKSEQSSLLKNLQQPSSTLNTPISGDILSLTRQSSLSSRSLHSLYPISRESIEPDGLIEMEFSSRKTSFREKSSSSPPKSENYIVSNKDYLSKRLGSPTNEELYMSAANISQESVLANAHLYQETSKVTSYHNQCETISKPACLTYRPQHLHKNRRHKSLSALPNDILFLIKKENENKITNRTENQVFAERWESNHCTNQKISNHVVNSEDSPFKRNNVQNQTCSMCASNVHKIIIDYIQESENRITQLVISKMAELRYDLISKIDNICNTIVRENNHFTSSSHYDDNLSDVLKSIV